VRREDGSAASTSSPCATISTPSGARVVGTARRHRRPCRMASWRRPAPGISTRTGALPVLRSIFRTSDHDAVSFAREGLVFIAIAALITAGTYALALNRRSWPLWLLAVLLTVGALWGAYFFRDPGRPGERSAQLVIAPAGGKALLISDIEEPAVMGGPTLRVSI